MMEKINNFVMPFLPPEAKLRLMFADEASFGRISEPAYCWCPAGIRPTVPCHRVREYVYAFGAVDPVYGDSQFIIAPNCNTAWMSEFLKVLSAAYPNDYLLVCLDNAGWHKAKALFIPHNITLFYLPPYTPEMNVIEPIWKEVRNYGFKNTLFNSLSDVVDRLATSLISLSQNAILSICSRKWIQSIL